MHASSSLIDYPIHKESCNRCQRYDKYHSQFVVPRGCFGNSQINKLEKVQFCRILCQYSHPPIVDFKNMQHIYQNKKPGNTHNISQVYHADQAVCI